MIHSFNKISKVKGLLYLPGDKSISHRAVMLASLAKGKSIIKNLANSDDVQSTLNCFRNLGINYINANNTVEITGKGFKGFSKPLLALNAGNSGTTARLLTGILSAQSFTSIITGDLSLSKRPMKRIIVPLELMNAKIKHSSFHTLPLEIYPSNINAINYELPIASAQVKSSIILAALHLDDETTIIESVPSRNHTEKLLNLHVEKINNKNYIKTSKKNFPLPDEYFIPSDISTASFFIVLTLINQNSELTIKNISLNETRTGFIKVLKKMNADIEIMNLNSVMNEEYGDLKIKSSKLVNIEIPEEMIPNIIDEIPILTIAGLFADGNFRINNAAELRFKESDRIKSICNNLIRMGYEVDEFNDGYEIKKRKGFNINDTLIESYNDHRIAMAFSILSLSVKAELKINDFQCVSISNPDFIDQIKSII